MRYIRIEPERCSNEPSPLWARIPGKILVKIVPAGNPDLEGYYDDTKTWWLEVDDDGLPQREIGFDASGQPIVLGPVGDNVGFLVDSCDDWSDVEGDSLEAAKSFEATWQALWPRFADLKD